LSQNYPYLSKIVETIIRHSLRLSDCKWADFGETRAYKTTF